MGLFGDRLLLRLDAFSTPLGQLDLRIDKIAKKSPHLLPFSCVSLIGSQLTVLAPGHARSLLKKVLDFIETPEGRFEATRLVSGFELEIFEGKGRILYNQFAPFYSENLTRRDDNPLQMDIQRLLMNYVVSVFDKVKDGERSNLRVFLLLTIMFHQGEIVPIIRRINMRDIQQRARLARTVIDFTSTIYWNWDSPKSITPGSRLFMEKLNAVKDSIHK